jgi:hypothetical protein
VLSSRAPRDPIDRGFIPTNTTDFKTDPIRTSIAAKDRQGIVQFARHNEGKETSVCGT